MISREGEEVAARASQGAGIGAKRRQERVLHMAATNADLHAVAALIPSYPLPGLTCSTPFRVMWRSRSPPLASRGQAWASSCC